MTFIRRSKSGVSRIVRDTYNNKAASGKTWWDWVALVKARARGMCETPGCKNAGAECHHITPLSRGGVTALWNLIYLCKMCHDKRHKHMAGRKH